MRRTAAAVVVLLSGAAHSLAEAAAQREPLLHTVRVLRDGVVMGLANHTELISRTGAHIPIDDSAAPIKDEEGRVKWNRRTRSGELF